MSTIKLKSPIILIQSGVVPLVSNLPEGTLAVGIVNGIYSAYTNIGGVVIEVLQDHLKLKGTNVQSIQTDVALAANKIWKGTTQSGLLVSLIRSLSTGDVVVGDQGYSLTLISKGRPVWQDENGNIVSIATVDQLTSSSSDLTALIASTDSTNRTWTAEQIASTDSANRTYTSNLVNTTDAARKTATETLVNTTDIANKNWTTTQITNSDDTNRIWTQELVSLIDATRKAYTDDLVNSTDVTNRSWTTTLVNGTISNLQTWVNTQISNDRVDQTAELKEWTDNNFLKLVGGAVSTLVVTGSTSTGSLLIDGKVAATQDYVNQQISSIDLELFVIVSVLPTTGTPNKIYLVPSPTSAAGNEWQEWIWINSQWELIGQLKVDLTGYATETWVLAKDYVNSTTLSSQLSSKANQAITITAGTGLTGGGNLSANRTLALATSGVAAGTYTKTTVDVYGRVTSGTTLIASDIPSLDASKVTTGVFDPDLIPEIEYQVVRI